MTDSESKEHSGDRRLLSARTLHRERGERRNLGQQRWTAGDQKAGVCGDGGDEMSSGS